MSQTGSPGRYARSFNGLIGALIVTVVGVLVFAGFQSLGNDPDPFDPTPVDYLDVVASAQDSGLDLVYPPALPAGWTATAVDFEPGEVPTFGVSVLTDAGSYVGMVQEDASAEELLDTYVDESVDEAEPLRLPEAIAPTWAGYTDDGGDSAYVATVGDREVMVFGSAPPEQLAAVVASLTDAPVS